MESAALPGADDPISGQITAQVANLRAMGVWAPPGWRLSGKLSAQAQLSGTLGAPQYEGRVLGQELGATQSLQGVHLADGTLDLRLKGDHARLESLTARDGTANGGSLSLSGDAVLGAEPLLKNTADGYAPRPDYRPVTKFENRGLKLGHGVWDLVFVKK